MGFFGTNQDHNYSQDWFGEDTFKVFPRILYQFYKINPRACERELPCIYALLPNKQEEASMGSDARLLGYYHDARFGESSNQCQPKHFFKYKCQCLLL